MRILEAHHCAFWFPLLTSYTIRSEPRLLEYQLLSSFPFCGSLSKRFPISRKIRICPTLSVLRQKFLFDSFSLFEDLLPCLKSFRWLLSIYFSLKSAALFQQNFHDVRRYCNLKTLILYHQVSLEGGGFKPKFSVKSNWRKWDAPFHHLPPNRL